MNKIIYLSLSLFLTSCYCFNKVSKPDVRFLSQGPKIDLCNMHDKGGNAIQINPYFGFPLQEKMIINSHYKQFTNFQFQQIGQFGIKTEKYIHFISVPFKTLGLGIDVSESFFSFKYQEVPIAPISNFIKVNQTRLMLSASFISLVQKNLIGYFSLQGGKNITNYHNSNSTSSYNNSQNILPNISYRIGYGMHYYIKNLYAFNLEVGYGNAGYVRMGIVKWF
ncbi:MAG: hypothetical protein HYR91_04840 [Flavobacteriia bacterium]|nr:hypothetical protein [Flavobacteriia bacterium]